MRPADRKYLKSHEWIKLQDDVATIGITDFAVSHLSDLVFLDLPSPGTTITANEPFGEIESVKAVSDLYSPASGQVLETNDALAENLEQLNADPFGAAWMIKIKVTGQSKDLLDAKAYEAHCQAEDH